jgi:hypothetical protein
VGRSDVGLGRKRKAQMLFSLVELVEPGQHLAEMIVRSRMAKRQSEHPFQRLPRLLVPPEQTQDPTKRHQRLDRARLQRQ